MKSLHKPYNPIKKGIFPAILTFLLICATILSGCGSTTSSETTAQNVSLQSTPIRLGGLKGPTTMGLAKLLTDAKEDATIDFTLAASADELTPALIQGDLDMAAVPANLASVLYNKTEGKIQVLAVNTLGVLYIVDTGTSINNIEDLRGKTLLATGKGTTPEYSLRYLLEANGLNPDTDVTIEWKSEATEIISCMKADETAETIALLPQPFVTVAKGQLPSLRVAISLNDEWNQIDNSGSLVTGVLVARKEFVEQNIDTVQTFLQSYRDSITFANEQPQEASVMIEELDIVKAAVAKSALSACNLTYLDGEDMKQTLSTYLNILYQQNPKSVGGAMPKDDFYYVNPQ